MNLNKVFVLGNLTRDPERRNLPSGQAVCNFGLATNRFYTDKDGQKQQVAEFHNIVAFGNLAEIASQYLKKGSLALIEGRLQTRNWQDQASGITRYRTEIVAERLQLGPKSATTGQSAYQPQQPTSYPAGPQIKPAVNTENIPVIEEDVPQSNQNKQQNASPANNNNPANPVSQANDGPGSAEPTIEPLKDEDEDEIDVKNIPF